MSKVILYKDTKIGVMPQTWSLFRVGTGPGRAEGLGFTSEREARDFAQANGHEIVEIRTEGKENAMESCPTCKHSVAGTTSVTLGRVCSEPGCRCTGTSHAQDRKNAYCDACDRTDEQCVCGLENSHDAAEIWKAMSASGRRNEILADAGCYISGEDLALLDWDKLPEDAKRKITFYLRQKTGDQMFNGPREKVEEPCGECGKIQVSDPKRWEKNTGPLCADCADEFFPEWRTKGIDTWGVRNSSSGINWKVEGVQRGGERYGRKS